MQSFVLFLTIFPWTKCSSVVLPSKLTLNSSFSNFSTIYLCHLEKLKNEEEIFLNGFDLIDDGQKGRIHHLLLYECSKSTNLEFSARCGEEKFDSINEPISRFCQTRIIFSWAKGGQKSFRFPRFAALRLEVRAELLLEIHLEKMSINDRPVGLDLKFRSQTEKTPIEIGILTVGTLIESTIFLPPRLETIDFTSFCSRRCVQQFFSNRTSIEIVSLLVHAHRRATKIRLEFNDGIRSTRLVDKNPFEFDRQEIFHFQKPFPKVRSNDEISLICSYSTINDSNKVTRAGRHSNDEMCQGFIYYFPKIRSFPLCLSFPIYRKSEEFDFSPNWTDRLSQKAKIYLESTVEHLTMCGDNIFGEKDNRTSLKTEIEQFSLRKMRTLKIHEFYPFFYVFFFVFLLILKKIHELTCFC